MIKLLVKEGKIHTAMKQDSNIPIFEELGQGIAELLTEFQAELIRNGNSRKEVDDAYIEMMDSIMAKNAEMVEAKLQRKLPGI